jgi:hypothetical protein
MKFSDAPQSISAVVWCLLPLLPWILILIIIFSSLPYFPVLDTMYGCSLVSGDLSVVPIPWATCFSLRLPSLGPIPEGGRFPPAQVLLSILLPGRPL